MSKHERIQLTFAGGNAEMVEVACPECGETYEVKKALQTYYSKNPCNNCMGSIGGALYDLLKTIIPLRRRQ